MTARRDPPDQADRDAAVRARGVNVLVDAGAGTGKTTLLVERLLEMVAPGDDREAEVPLARIAAVTFTRKAAGELRLRVRERLLAALAGKASPVRRSRLKDALAAADTAFIGTIHGFADRLLRRFPVEAGLSPSYEVVEDTDALCRETFDALLHAAGAGRLAEELEGSPLCDRARAAEAETAIVAALDARVLAESREGAWSRKDGLDALVAGFILNRDVPPPDRRAAPFELSRVEEQIDRFLVVASASSGRGDGSLWVAQTAERLRTIARETDPVVLYREVGRLVGYAPGFAKLKMGRDFPDDPGGWEAWKQWNGRGEGEAIRDALTRPLRRFMATRLARCFPAVIALYEKVKARHRVVDQLDLLLKLRDLLRGNRRARGELQAQFSHLFVDEFQDTDPLQAEVILYLCEEGTRAGDWRDVRVAPGRLTLVGDPKQSIYRFRRADIAVYEAVRSLVLEGPCLKARLTTNFRSQAALVAHLNDRFDAILGTSADGHFDRDAGTVANQRLEAWRTGGRGACVVALPLEGRDGNAASDRALEATVLATWIRAAVETRKQEIPDPATRRPRPVRYGDIAVLAHSTWSVGLLLDALDRLGVPWSARGGALFLEDPLHRQFLLGLRALANGADGVAKAALLREPFFALDLADVARARASVDPGGDGDVERVRAAEALLAELRKSRLARPPGDTARDLLERTGFARAVAFGPNGPQRLDRLRELCFELERLAAAEGLDYDGATARMREWVIDPVGLDPPRPVGGDAVQILTIHQAKGLEYPVVAWWDAHAEVAPRDRSSPWFVDRTGSSWALSLDGLRWEEPEGCGVLAREQAYHGAERLRLVYVAGTRARDLLVLPLASGGGYITRELAGELPAAGVNELEAWTADHVPAWALGVEPPPEREPARAGAAALAAAARYREAAEEAGRARLVPRGIAAEAHRAAEDAEDEAGTSAKVREGRHGRLFGDTVHAAIGLALFDPGLEPAAAVARAARSTGLSADQAEAAEDVARALRTLEREGLRRVPGPGLRLEYPVAAGGEDLLVSGYVDLVASQDGEVSVVDFKTDAPPRGDVRASHPAYVEQVLAYGRALVALGLAGAGRVRCGLLFTGDGGMRWV
ncbi:MAG TPA: UvrD-helicase domain-containing protein [Anaeromyxobacteraceae bacterium]|nr:UvrD-helicase domain-containing protein [Anaeromyxobacteraceae bacterium]